MQDAAWSNTTADQPGLLPAGLSFVICLFAPVATLAIVLRDGYMRLRSGDEFVFLVILLGPYLLLGLFAWRRRRSRRQSVALVFLTVLLAIFGLWILASESAGYRAALADSGRGPDYMRERYQRTALFVVPALQWIACLVIGLVLFVDARRRSRWADDATRNVPRP